MYFILHEEEEYRLNNINYDNSIEIKTELLKDNDEKEKNNKHINELNKNSDNNIIKNKNWFKYNLYSCRYDSFFLVYCYTIKPKLLDLNLEEIEIFKLISNDIISLNEEFGIWEIINEYKSNYNFLYIYYQHKNTCNQLFEVFNKNHNFCFKLIY